MARDAASGAPVRAAPAMRTDGPPTISTPRALACVWRAAGSRTTRGSAEAFAARGVRWRGCFLVLDSPGVRSGFSQGVFEILDLRSTCRDRFLPRPGRC